MATSWATTWSGAQAGPSPCSETRSTSAWCSPSGASTLACPPAGPTTSGSASLWSSPSGTPCHATSLRQAPHATRLVRRRREQVGDANHGFPAEARRELHQSLFQHCARLTNMRARLVRQVIRRHVLAENVPCAVSLLVGSPRRRVSLHPYYTTFHALAMCAHSAHSPLLSSPPLFGAHSIVRTFWASTQVTQLHARRRHSDLRTQGWAGA
mmetsp:Transcript_19825/g.53417  ORF Transcript_19825/g.53417 Transcript_19825/m.53417 type:complete len:211 (-) Transcript_19825:272-904(-)